MIGKDSLTFPNTQSSTTALRADSLFKVHRSSLTPGQRARMVRLVLTSTMLDTQRLLCKARLKTSFAALVLESPMIARIAPIPMEKPMEKPVGEKEPLVREKAIQIALFRIQ
jgi:hypothetical protein